MNGLNRDDIIRSYLMLHPDTQIDMQQYAIPLRIIRHIVDACAVLEREKCARICEDVNYQYDNEFVSALWCAVAIRKENNDAA
jgi:hypothetical protein